MTDKFIGAVRETRAAHKMVEIANASRAHRTAPEEYDEAHLKWHEAMRAVCEEYVSLADARMAARGLDKKTDRHRELFGQSPPPCAFTRVDYDLGAASLRFLAHPAMERVSACVFVFSRCDAQGNTGEKACDHIVSLDSALDETLESRLNAAHALALDVFETECEKEARDPFAGILACKHRRLRVPMTLADYALNVLPPIGHSAGVYAMGEPHGADGGELTYFWFRVRGEIAHAAYGTREQAHALLFPIGEEE